MDRVRTYMASDLAADRAQALALTPVSRETTDRLDRFVELFLQTQSHTNLVGPATVPQLWTRHIADSLQLLDLAPQARTWLDLGSGGGFPGLVLACVLADQPGATVHLVESTAKKAAFLRHAGQALGLPVTVHHGRIESLSPRFAVDVITARALAPLPALLGYVAPFLKTGAQALLLKGQDVEVELTEAAKCWTIEATMTVSRTSPSGRILVVRGLHRRGARK
jgi:16S rRNA (guanine527-N7)-methyltransferase